MDLENLGRLNRLIEAADLEHQIEIASGSGSGNRQFEQTAGALEALQEVKKILTASQDPTQQRVTGNVIRNLVKLRIFGLPLPITTGPEWLHIGEISELPKDRSVEYKVVDQISGTRLQVLQAFLDRKKKKPQ